MNKIKSLTVWSEQIHRNFFLLVACVLMVALLFANADAQLAQADGNNTLAQSVNLYIRGDVVAVGVGLRGTGTGDLTLTGIPAGASIKRAYLYWATLGSNTYNSVTIDDADVSGALIGTAADTCWGVQHNYVYRSDVTSLIPGNGTYTIAGLPDSLTNGDDSQGAALVVIYADPNAQYRTIVINDGAVALDKETSSHVDTLSGYKLSDSPVNAQITYMVGDGQAIWVSGDVTFNGSTLATDIFNGSDGAYWDTLRFDVSALVEEAPVVTTIDNTDPGDPESPDCLLWAGTIFSVTSPPPGASENELSLVNRVFLYGDVVAAGVGLRGTGDGDIVVSGIPVGARVAKAYLYWATLGSSNRFDSVNLNGSPVKGEHLSTSADTCWGVSNNFVYQADVSGIVDSNGTYRITGLPDDLYGTGNDSQGASLVILYTSSPARYDLRTILIYAGAVTLDLDVHSYTNTLTGFKVDDPLTEAHITYLIGDGQSQWENGNVTFNGTSIASNIFNGVDGEHWGTLTFDVTTLVEGDPATTSISNQVPEGESPDCLLWAAAVFSVTRPQADYDQFVFLPLAHR